MNEAITGDGGHSHKAEELRCCLMTRVGVWEKMERQNIPITVSS